MRVIPIPQPRERDLAYEACVTLNNKRDPTLFERFLAPLGMTTRDKIDKSVAELKEEKSMVSELLGK